MVFPSVWMPFKLHYLVVWFGFYFLLISYSFQNWHKVFYLFFKPINIVVKEKLIETGGNVGVAS